jgi:hypothetical protein
MRSVFGDLDEYFVLHPVVEGAPQGGSTGTDNDAANLLTFLNTEYPKVSMVSFGTCKTEWDAVCASSAGVPSVFVQHSTAQHMQVR